MHTVFDVDQLPGRTITYQQQDYLFFSGTAYLGLPQHPAHQQLFTEAIVQYGTSYGSSRNGNLQLRVYEQAETKLAAFVAADPIQKPSALTLSSGMMAGQVVSNWLRGQSASFVYAPGAHPALWHEPSVQLPALSFTDWIAQLPHQLQTLPPGPVAILTNALDAGHSERYPFDWVSSLPEDRAITLVVDDSHGLGVLNGGRGIWPELPAKPAVRVLVTASLAKAMGMPGGIIFSDAATIKTICQTAFFGACSPMPPACLAAYLRADTLYDEQQERLQRNIRLAEKLLLPTGLFQQATGYPVFFTEHNDLYPFLLQRNTFVYSFAYPTPAHRPNTRIIISAFHEPDDIEHLAGRVHEFSARK